MPDMKSKQHLRLFLSIACGVGLSISFSAADGQQLMNGSSEGQQSAIDSTHFLWYTGHWSKTKKNVFIINKNSGQAGSGGGGLGVGGAGGGGGTGSGSGMGDPSGSDGSGGGTITVGPDGKVTMSGGAVAAWNKQMDQAEQSADQFIQALDDPHDNLDVTTHKLNEALKPDAEAQKQRVADLKVPDNQDMLDPDDPVKPLNNDQIPDYCQQIKSQYYEIMNFYKQHVKDLVGNDPTNPVPPKFEYTCYVCDSNIQKKYDTAVAQYVRAFMKPEADLIKKGNMILHQLAVSGMSQEKGIQEDKWQAFFQNNKNEPSKSGACSYIELNSLATAIYDIHRHLYTRGLKLVQDNLKNYQAIRAIQAAYTATAGQWDIVCDGKSGYQQVFEQLQGMYSDAIEDYMKRIKKSDWRAIADAPFVMSLLRDQCMLGGSDNQSVFEDYLYKMQTYFNAFELNIEMDIKTGDANAYRIAHIKGKCHIMPEFDRWDNQCYHWVVADEEEKGLFGYPFKKFDQTIDCKVITNEMTTPPGAPKITYTGTKKYTAVLKHLRMDFCNPGNDTIQLTGFTPNPSDAGLWTIPMSPSQNMGLNGQEQYFESIAEKKQLAGSGEAKKQTDDLVQKALQLRAQMDAMKQANALQAPGHAGSATANMEKIKELKDQAMGLTSNATVAKMAYLDFVLQVKNFDTVLVKQVFDAREINPKQANVIIYGKYTVDIENRENGKKTRVYVMHPNK
jgi:hypothetical protein